jgi:hypothetical protein
VTDDREALRVALLTPWPEWPLARQTPGSALRWGRCAFAINPRHGRFDACVAYDGVPFPAALDCPSDRTILITGEPPSIKHYDERFAAQFHEVVTCHTNLPHPRKIHDQQGYPWYAGVERQSDGSVVARQTFDEMMTEAPPAKAKLLSVVVSDKLVTPGHKHRRTFVKALLAHFGDAVDVFGRGTKPVADKAAAIVPYKYHLAFENSEFYDYWTEKLSDAYLCFAFPLYWGCVNIDKYFPRESLEKINIYEPSIGIEQIERAISENRYETSMAERAAARRRVLTEYNMFAMLDRLLEEPSERPPEPLLLHPESHFRDSLRRKISKRLRRAIPRKLRRKQGTIL